ncbi:MAG TPA: DUF4230 domain-containing protein [Longimicrobiaceae bacterium]|nr:DUF4230 domain-containing protein [Longimicrobiaceae bacterium]
MRPSARNLVRIALGIGIFIMVVTMAFRLFWAPPRVSETEVRELIHTSIQRESTASFYVTGTLDVTTTAIVDNTRILFPDLLDLRLGTTRATVRTPGRVSYGFDVSELEREMIYVDGGIIWIQIPRLQVYSAEPNLSALEIETDVGWARMPASARSAERRAIGELNDALRRQGEAHLSTAMQPRVNTARALELLLVPILQAAGIEQPQLRFELGEGVLLQGGA